MKTNGTQAVLSDGTQVWFDMETGSDGRMQWPVGANINVPWPAWTTLGQRIYVNPQHIVWWYHPDEPDGRL